MAKIMYTKHYYPNGNTLDARGAWFIAHEEGYLHSDGIVRYSTWDIETKKYTGYFSTFGEAQFILNNY